MNYIVHVIILLDNNKCGTKSAAGEEKVALLLYEAAMEVVSVVSKTAQGQDCMYLCYAYLCYCI